MVWLGPADKNTAAAFSILQRLQAHNAFTITQKFPLEERKVADLSHSQIRAQLALALGNDILPPITDYGWAAFAKLLERDWFTRVWTFQEAVLCYKGDALVKCGDSYIPIITFLRASMLLGNEHIFAGVDFTRGRGALSQISTFRFHVEHRKVTPLVWLLQNNNSRNCRDPRDRIYAMLGMRNEDGPGFIVDVNYAQQPSQVFIDIARKIIRSQKSLRICADAPERVSGTEVANLPSWVPDWSRSPSASSFELLNPAQSYFSASCGRDHRDYVQNSSILETRGKLVDTVVGLIHDAEIPDAVTQVERRRVLVDDVLPVLYQTLRSRSRNRSDAALAHLIINTVTVGGYTRNMNIGHSGLQPQDWSESTCDQMLSFILQGSGRPMPPLFERWIHALTREVTQCANRRFAQLNEHDFALVPKASIPGDRIAVLHGSSLPLVLRRTDLGHFRMIGACYVDAIMKGQAVDWTIGDRLSIC